MALGWKVTALARRLQEAPETSPPLDVVPRFPTHPSSWLVVGGTQSQETLESLESDAAPAAENASDGGPSNSDARGAPEGPPPVAAGDEEAKKDDEEGLTLFGTPCAGKSKSPAPSAEEPARSRSDGGASPPAALRKAALPWHDAGNLVEVAAGRGRKRGRLGSGTGGHVDLKILKGTRDMFAVKRPRDGQDLAAEFEASVYFRNCPHPNVLAASFFTGPLDFPAGLAFPPLLGNLADVRSLPGVAGLFPLPLAKALAGGVARGLAHLHCHSFIHRDLKPENILLGVDDRGVLDCKIADLGWSRTMGVERGASEPVPDCPMTPGAVTPAWRAPEIELGLPYSYAADNWSLGLIVAELLTGEDWVRGPRKPQSENILVWITALVGPITSSEWPAAAKTKRYQAFQATETRKAERERWPRAVHPFSHPARALDTHEQGLVDGLLQLVPDKRLTARGAAEHRAIIVGGGGGGASQPVTSTALSPAAVEKKDAAVQACFVVRRYRSKRPARYYPLKSQEPEWRARDEGAEQNRAGGASQPASSKMPSVVGTSAVKEDGAASLSTSLKMPSALAPAVKEQAGGGASQPASSTTPVAFGKWKFKGPLQVFFGGGRHPLPLSGLHVCFVLLAPVAERTR